MAPVAPWEVDNTQVHSLTQQLHQCNVERSALQDTVAKLNSEVKDFRRAREDAEQRARHAELHAREVDSLVEKTQGVRASHTTYHRFKITDVQL